MASSWSSKNIPDLSGKTAVVTGANSGIGFEAADALAGKSATVVLACRHKERGEAAVERILHNHPLVKTEVMHLDLADLSSVRAFAREFENRFHRLDMLINNAGIMAVPFGKTADGFELQLGTNHLGHFALTGLLIGPISRTPGARVVTVSSVSHRVTGIDFDNLQGEKDYGPWKAYEQSKLANLLFTFELQRRFEKAGIDAIAAAAHPGWTTTNLFAYLRMVSILSSAFAQTPAMGALPILYAAAAPDVRGGEYFGPAGLFHLSGYPVRAAAGTGACDENNAAQLWTVSETMTGIRYLS
jgi:NAD(P)-dependent dehydrogenase (short-subunit alcohol dehydrogenase family)